ncbi:MAG: M64 family metallopeptidase, partial [Rhodothermales bacterium]
TTLTSSKITIAVGQPFPILLPHSQDISLAMYVRIANILVAAIIAVNSTGCDAPRHNEDTWKRDQPPATLRIDYLHTGSADSESFSLDDLIVEGPWPGRLDRSIDRLQYGPYFFEVRDVASGEPLYSRGFGSIFGEWQTTAEARDTTLSFEESLRFPKTDLPVELVVSKRDRDLILREVWRTEIDPSQARPLTTNPADKVWNILESGPPSTKVDLLMLGDGYTLEEMDKWHADARRLADTLLSHEPFLTHRADFNVRAIDSPSLNSGISSPSTGVIHETPIGATYDSFNMQRYVLTFANKRWRDIAAAAPYEFVVIIANNRQYGGAGIYNLYSTVAADHEYTAYVLVHEFGHQFAGLGDEYYTSDVTYEIDQSRPEPWSPNVTADPIHPKWKDLVDPSTPLPTPWPKEAFDQIQTDIQSQRRELRRRNASEKEVEALFAKERARTRELLSQAEYADDIGAFEGANYVSKGYYRPQIDCIMFTRERRKFCRVCTNAIARVIDEFAAPTGSLAMPSVVE